MLIDNSLSIGVYYSQNSKGAEGPTSAPLLFVILRAFSRSERPGPRSARGAGCAGRPFLLGAARIPIHDPDGRGRAPASAPARTGFPGIAREEMCMYNSADVL